MKSVVIESLIIRARSRRHYARPRPTSGSRAKHYRGSDEDLWPAFFPIFFLYPEDKREIPIRKMSGGSNVVCINYARK